MLLAITAALPAAATPVRALLSLPVARAPVIDGRADDPAWANTPPLVTHDPIADIDIRLRSVHTAETLFLLVEFPDPSESREHRVLHWDRTEQRYRSGPEREDVFVIKWSLESHPVDLRLGANHPYRADIWYWKAARTDPSGYADDKLQRYGQVPIPPFKRIMTGDGSTFYLSRQGDRGRAAYRMELPIDYRGERVTRYRPQPPSGSRADVRAKGRWRSGTWTIEFARALDTGHDDDLRIAPGGVYRFGVSRFEIAGRAPNPRAEEPRFGTGNVGEPLDLVVR